MTLDPRVKHEKRLFSFCWSSVGEIFSGSTCDVSFCDPNGLKKGGLTFSAFSLNELLKREEIMQTSGGATALMYACQQCKESEVLEILRKQPYSVKDRDRTLKTPLHYCAENPNTSCAEAVIKVAPELVNAQDENGYCPLHLAVIAGNKPLIKLLITKGANVNIHDNEGHSAVHWAIVSSEKEALEMIIKAGANPSTPDIHGGYPLHYAVQMCGSNYEYLRSYEDTVRVVEGLLNFGVDVNVKDKDGRQPILWAASAGSADAVIHLVSSGACVEAADKDGLTALHCAASRGHTTTLETLISLCGANVDVIDGNGCSALFYSVTLGHADATELLLELGAEPNRQDRKGRTPAHCGAAKGQLETLRILQKHSGNLWMRNVKGDIPLHEAVASGRKDLVIWLLSQNTEAINLANNDGRCPLHIASMYNNTEMVKVLLDSKSLVNPVMRTSKGVLMTPLNVALCKGHRSCGKYLQLHGGVPFSKVSRSETASVLAVQASPSDDRMYEKRKENVASSQSKISKSRSSSDIQGNQEIVKTETGDKKKVYRRRKKKKISSNINTQDSDSGSDDESIHELKVKIVDNRRSKKSGEDEVDDDRNAEDEENVMKTVQQDVKAVKKEKSPIPRTNSGKTRKQEIAEEAIVIKKTTKTKTESKPLQKNKSFNETKNVSDLSPEDFPPRMQTINQLDAEIMEPDVEMNKAESEIIESKPDGAEVREAISASVTTQIKAREETTEKSVDGDSLPKEENNIQNESVTSETPQENIKKDTDVKKSNGGSRKGETGTKTPESKSFTDESSDRKSVKSPKSSKDENPVKKDSKKGSEGNERQRKTPSPKACKTDQKEKISESKANNKNEEVEKIETENTHEINEYEETKTEPKLIPQEIPQQELVEVEKLDLRNSADEKKEGEGKIEEENLESKVQLEEQNVIIENTIESSKKVEETEPSEVEAPTEEVKTLNEEETSVISATKDEASFLPEGRQLKEVETLIFTENVEKPNEALSSQVFLSETSELTSEKNNPENPSEQPNVVGNTTQENLVEETNEKLEDNPQSDEKLVEETNISAGKLNPDGEDVAEGKSEDVDLDMEEGQVNKTEDEENEGGGFPSKKSNGLEHRHYKPSRVSRLCRRHRDFKEDMNQISVTQLVQNTIRKYHMERGIFYQLLELKRYQIRSGKANEQVLVKRLADEYDRSRVFLGMKPFSGLYKFREFEKFLYDQLKALNARRSFLFPEVKSYDDIDALSGFLKKSRYKIISEIPQPEMICTCITQRCHHSACAYTSVPCSAYNLRRHRHHRPKRESFFPRIEQPPSLKPESQKFAERPATLELIQGSEKHVITLPQNSPARGKRYYVTFTIRGAPGFKEEDFSENSKDYFKHRHAKSV